MDQQNFLTDLLGNLESVDEETFPALGAESPLRRFWAARQIGVAAKSEFPEAARSLINHIDAEKLSNAVKDSHWGVRLVANAAVREISGRFGMHLEGVSRQEIIENPIRVCKVLQQTVRPQ